MIPFHEVPFFMSCKPVSNYVRQCGALFSWTSCCQISWIQSSWVVSFVAVFCVTSQKTSAKETTYLDTCRLFLLITSGVYISLDGAYFLGSCLYVLWHCHATLMLILFRTSFKCSCFVVLFCMLYKCSCFHCLYCVIFVLCW